MSLPWIWDPKMSQNSLFATLLKLQFHQLVTLKQVTYPVATESPEGGIQGRFA
jgi:hypothetical protein